jgi:transposase
LIRTDVWRFSELLEISKDAVQAVFAGHHIASTETRPDTSAIRVDAVWLAVDALDMRSGTESALARVVNVFGSARPHDAYLFANRRANRTKVLVHDGVGIWLAARRLHAGKFAWPKDVTGTLTLTLTREQLDALVLGLSWQRMGEAGVIRVL